MADNQFQQDVYNAFEAAGARILPSDNEMRARSARIEAQYPERDRREAAFETVNADGFDGLADEVEALKQAGLYCGTCGHGNGCEHGIPYSRY